MALKLSREPYDIKRGKFSVGNAQGQTLLKCNMCKVWMTLVDISILKNKKKQLTFKCSGCGKEERI